MLPKPPPREQQVGFIYVPPYRIIGTSIAGEITSIQVPELDVCFDMGYCPRPMLASKYVAVSHGHMDHIGGLAYYCSQRHFQGMGPGNIVCPKEIAPAIQKMMEGYMDLERQKTPFNIIPLEPEQTVEIKNNIFLRGFPVEHTVPTFGYSIFERRTKLKPELVGLPQEKLTEMRAKGEEITRTLYIPLIAYVMDTAPGPALVREDVRKAQILITECTFFEPETRERAKVGMHLHVQDLAEWMRVLECQAVILGHISRRTHLVEARKQLQTVLGRQKAEKILMIMDSKANKERYERQQMDAGEHPTQTGERPPGRGGPRGGGFGGGGRGPGGPPRGRPPA